MAASANQVKVNIDWIDAEIFEKDDAEIAAHLEAHARHSACPAGSASAGPRARSRSVRFARERNVPYFGICFGMQMACIEAARNLAGIAGRQLDRIRRDRASRWSAS